MRVYRAASILVLAAHAAHAFGENGYERIEAPPQRRTQTFDLYYEGGKAAATLGGLAVLGYVAKKKYDKLAAKVKGMDPKRRRRSLGDGDGIIINGEHERRATGPVYVLVRRSTDAAPSVLLMPRKVSPETAKQMITAFKSVQLVGAGAAIPIALWNGLH